MRTIQECDGWLYGDNVPTVYVPMDTVHADDDHSVDKYREIAEMLESKDKNADTFQADQAASINAIRKYQSNKIQSRGKSCGRCGKSHPKDKCPAQDLECHKCKKKGHFYKMCRSGKPGNPGKQGKMNQRWKPRKFVRVHEIEENPNPSLYLVTEDGKTVGETDLNTAFELCDFTDAVRAHTIDIYANTNGPRYDSKDIQIHNVLQKSKTQAFTRIKMYPTSKEGKVTGQAQEIKCKLDTGPDANVVSLKDYKRINPSEFDSSGNSIVGFQDDQTTLKGYGGVLIKQYGVRVINSVWDKKLMKMVFHIVDAEGPVLLSLSTMRCMGLFTKHPAVYIETIDIHSVQYLARCAKDKVESDSKQE